MQSSTTNNSGSKPTEENSRLLQRILINLIVFIVLLTPIVVSAYLLKPVRRGFFCDDESIRYPYKTDTVTPTMLKIMVFLFPFIVLTIGEYSRQYNKGQLRNSRKIFCCSIPIWVMNGFKQLAYYCFGFLLTANVTEGAKFTIGRLRPHFMEVCQPQLTDGTTCYDLVNQHRYVENYFCLATGFSIHDVQQARYSFPSGHSSLSVYAMLYISLYLQERIQWRRSALAKHLVQFIFIMLTWFTVLTRVKDNWHHWSDVLSGALIGTLIALITANYVSKFFKNSYTHFDTLRVAEGLARQDTSVTLNEVLAAEPLPYIINQEAINGLTPENYCTKV